jgi:hypothetical protein
MSEDKNTGFRLPERLITMVDLNRTLRELKYLDDWLKQASIRSGGQEVKAPKTSATLDAVASLNNVSLLDENQRGQLINLLQGFKDSAPKIHMSFAVEPSAYFLNKVVVWLRANINPVILIEVGLQPALAAGCSVRTANKLFDMSLKNRFVDSRPFLIKSIEEISGNVPVENQTSATPETVTASVPQTVTEAPSSVVAKPQETESLDKKEATTENTDDKTENPTPVEPPNTSEPQKVEVKN